MRNSPFWWILIGFMLLLDLYVFQAVKVLTQSAGSRVKLFIHIGYWAISALAVITLLILPYLHFTQQHRLVRNTFFAIIVGLFFSKIIASVFLSLCASAFCSKQICRSPDICGARQSPLAFGSPAKWQIRYHQNFDWR